MSTIVPMDVPAMAVRRSTARQTERRSLFALFFGVVALAVYVPLAVIVFLICLILGGIAHLIIRAARTLSAHARIGAPAE